MKPQTCVGEKDIVLLSVIKSTWRLQTALDECAVSILVTPFFTMTLKSILYLYQLPFNTSITSINTYEQLFNTDLLTQYKLQYHSSPCHFYARCSSCHNSPNLSWLGTGTKYAGLHTRWLALPHNKQTKPLGMQASIFGGCPKPR